MCIDAAHGVHAVNMGCKPTSKLSYSFLFRMHRAGNRFYLPTHMSPGSFQCLRVFKDLFYGSLSPQFRALVRTGTETK
jgi:hypothetical protein